MNNFISTHNIIFIYENIDICLCLCLVLIWFDTLFRFSFLSVFSVCLCCTVLMVLTVSCGTYLDSSVYSTVFVPCVFIANRDKDRIN